MTDVAPLSGPAYDFAAGHVSTPEVASVAAKLTVSGWLNQPLASAVRLGVAVASGAVASYLSGKEARLGLPALSRQVPVTDVAPMSGPAYDFAAGQLSMPRSRPSRRS